MRADPAGPADTSMMRIVHSALRRDIARAQAALSEPPYPDEAQRTAIGDHLRWMMGFLQHHHEAEDGSLYPMVRAARPDAADLLDDMDSEHAAIQPAAVALLDAARRYSADPSSREAVLNALGELSDVLLPHLQREEDEAMPVVSSTITERQLRDWEQTHNVKPLSLPEKAFTGNWIRDGLSAQDEAIVAQLVPAIPRWLIRHVLVRGYRRTAFTTWRLAQHSGHKITLFGKASHHAEAPPEAVWRIVTDVTRTGEWSHECHSASWSGGTTQARAGAEFRGESRSGRSRWSRSCRVTEFTVPTVFAYRTNGRLFHDSTEWHWTLEPKAGGTRITQRYRVRRLPLWADRLLWLATPAHHDRRAALARDLEALAALAEREHASESRPTSNLTSGRT